jgi:DNA-binding MarR family transcriptional regulator
MTQAHKLARTSDPATSKAAARHIVGRLKARQSAALQAVRDWPGQTATELAEACGIFDPRIFNRRLPELEKLGMVERGPARGCRVTGRLAATWKAVKRGQ